MTPFRSQLDNSDVANYLPGHAGRNDNISHSPKTYMLMGAQTGGIIAAGGSWTYYGDYAVAKKYATFAVAPRNVHAPWNALPSFTYSGTAAVDVVQDISSYATESSYFTPCNIVAGQDYNGDGFMTRDEITFWDEDLIRAVTQQNYNEAQSYANSIGFLWDFSGFENSAAFIEAFASGTDIAGASSIQNSIVVTDTPGLTHNVGADWDPSGIATVKKYQFNSGTSIVNDIANSNFIRDQIAAKISSQKTAILTAFPGVAGSDPDVTFNNWSLDIDSVNFSSLPETGDPDLKFSIGKAAASNMTISFTVEHVVFTEKRYQDGGSGGPYYWHQDTYRVKSISVSGIISDLYDFDYDATYTQSGAAVQAGYGTLGIGGRIFYTEFDLSNNSLSAPNFLVQAGTTWTTPTP